MNELKEEWRRREVVKGFKRRMVDVLDITDTHLKGCGSQIYGCDNEKGVWEGLV